MVIIKVTEKFPLERFFLTIVIIWCNHTIVTKMMLILIFYRKESRFLIHEASTKKKAGVALSTTYYFSGMLLEIKGYFPISNPSHYL